MKNDVRLDKTFIIARLNVMQDRLSSCAYLLEKGEYSKLKRNICIIEKHAADIQKNIKCATIEVIDWVLQDKIKEDQNKIFKDQYMGNWQVDQPEDEQ